MTVGFAGTARFRVIRPLGVGGMGAVYEAFDREQRTRIALKTLLHLTPHAIERFKREFRALQGVQHPNLVTLGELFEDGGRWFFTMELIEGGDLLAWVRPSGVLDIARLHAALGQLAGALHAIHGAGKVHRDVKPSNVKVTPGGRVTLLDFGLARDTDGDALLSGDQVVGTAAYMAPEQAVSGQVGPEADWYAFGIVLHEALTGRLPFTGPPLQIMLDKQRREPAPPAGDDVPADLAALTAALLRFDRTARPGGAAILE
ncbi:MAG TPA: serine/threonine-protein kinase, partial [Kofleriaceae bacterium]|nr:serine/threonine-protein kinase [Kofleriaceae bacterium]